MPALRFRLECEHLDTGAALEAVAIARRSIGRLKVKSERPARVGSAQRMTG